MPDLTEEQPILAELRALGLDVEHIQDLYNRPLDYRPAMPLLVSWIPRVQDETVKVMLVRAVTDRAARGIAGPILAGHAVAGLAKLQPPEARSALERFVDHEQGWVRLAARRAIAGIDRKAARAG